MLVNTKRVVHVSFEVLGEGKVTGYAKFADGSVETLTTVGRARELQAQCLESSADGEQLLLG